MIVGIRRNECGLFSILGCQGNLMIPLKSIQEAHPWVPICGVHQLVNLRHRKWVFQACSVQIHEIYTYPSFSVLLLYYYDIRQPFREIDFLYCPSFLQPLNFRLHWFDMLPGRSSRFLLLRREWWVYVELMDNEFGVNPGHLIQSPCKHIHILYK